MYSTLTLSIALAIFPNLMLAQNTANWTCFNSAPHGFDPSHCSRALRNIVYDSNGCLDSLSKAVFVWHETCVINIQKPQNLQPNRLWVESTVQSITQRCKTSGGIQKYREGITAKVYRSTASNIYQINQPRCQKRKCNYQVNDCMIAINRLPVDAKGNFITPTKIGFFPQSTATWGNCTVSITTTDSAAIRSSHVEANPAFKKILHQCGSRPGSIYISGGTAGNNGDIILSTRASRSSC